MVFEGKVYDGEVFQINPPTAPVGHEVFVIPDTPGTVCRVVKAATELGKARVIRAATKLDERRRELCRQAEGVAVSHLDLAGAYQKRYKSVHPELEESPGYTLITGDGRGSTSLRRERHP